MFKCVCGKEFESKQALSGHKSFCKEYLGEDRYLQIINKNKERQMKAKQTLMHNTKIKKEQELQQWISEKHKCEKCGKVMTEKYASGRFCCKECARGFSNYKPKDLSSLKYKCELCNKCYETESGLNMHISLKHKPHIDDRLFILKNVTLDVTNKYLNEYRQTHTTCEICGKSVEDMHSNLCIDHNHTTNKFRGLLCNSCNRSLGWFENNEQNILEYLKNKGRQHD